MELALIDRKNDTTTLPGGWTSVTHASGLLCFLHETSGVISWSKPYKIKYGFGMADKILDIVRDHAPPLEVFAQGSGIDQQNTAQKSKLMQAEAIVRELGQAALGNLDSNLNNNSSNHDNDDKNRSRKRHAPVDPTNDDCNTLADDGSTCEKRLKITVGDGISVENPEGKTAMSFLMDYAKQWANVRPEYIQTVTDNVTAPYHCTVLIQGREFGHGNDTTKQLARQRAAEIALEALLPGVWAKFKTNGMVREITDLPTTTEISKTPTTSVEEFNKMKINDQRVLQGCMDHHCKTPAQLLTEYQTKHRGISVNYTNIDMPTTERQKFKVIASAGKKSAEGVAGNKKVAKQYAAQALLAILNPKVVTYRELLKNHENSVKQHAGITTKTRFRKNKSKYGGPSAMPQVSPASVGPANLTHNTRELQRGSGYANSSPYATQTVCQFDTVPHVLEYAPTPSLYSQYEQTTPLYSQYAAPPTPSAMYDYSYHNPTHIPPPTAWTYLQPPNAPQPSNGVYNAPPPQTYSNRPDNGKGPSYHNSNADKSKALNY